MKFKLLLLFFLISFSVINSSSIAEIIEQSINSYIIIFIVFLLSALTYMAGSLFSVPSWTARGKDLLYQGIFSLVIMASFPVIYSIFNDLFMTLFLGSAGFNIPPGTNMFDISENLIIWNYLYFFIYLVFLTVLNIFTLTFFGRTYTVPLANTQVPFDLSVLQSPLLMLINMGVSILSLSIMINGFQLLFLKFVRYALIPFLLPIGLLLRAFPSSMNAGNILVGIAIASYIIVPVVYAMDLYVLPSLLETPDSLKDQGHESIYNSYSMMISFYNKRTLDTVIIKSNQCKIVTVAKEALNAGFFELDTVEEINEELKTSGCDIDVTDIGGFYDMAVKPLDTSTKIIAGTFILPSVIDKSVRAYSSIFKRLFNFFKSKRSTSTGGTTTPDGSGTTSPDIEKTPPVSETPPPASTSKFRQYFDKFKNSIRLINVLSALWGGAAMFYIMIFFYEFVFGAITSFIILSVILPFIKFTIIILFIREFTMNFLGTQVSLGHVTRLL